MEFVAHVQKDITALAQTQAFIHHRNVPLENTAVQKDFQLIRATASRDLIQVVEQNLFNVRLALRDVTALAQAYIHHWNVPLENTAVQKDFQLIRATARRDLIQLVEQNLFNVRPAPRVGTVMSLVLLLLSFLVVTAVQDRTLAAVRVMPIAIHALQVCTVLQSGYQIPADFVKRAHTRLVVQNLRSALLAQLVYATLMFGRVLSLAVLLWHTILLIRGI
jgi:hypothetical protein